MRMPGDPAPGGAQMFYFFENFVLDPARRELRCGNALIAVQPQVFDLLEYLVTNRDHVVSKDDILQAVWGGRTVSELSLTARMEYDTGRHRRRRRTAATNSHNPAQRHSVCWRFFGRGQGRYTKPLLRPPEMETAGSRRRAGIKQNPRSSAAHYRVMRAIARRRERPNQSGGYTRNHPKLSQPRR